MIVIYAYSGGHAPAASSCTFSHETTNHSNRLLLVSVHQERSSGTPDVSSVTYNGVALTKAIDTVGSEGGRAVNVEWWYMLNPTVQTANIVATFSDASNDENIVQAVDIYNVKQIAPLNTYTGGGVNISSLAMNITPQEYGDLMIGIFGNDRQDRHISPTTGVTELVESKGNGGSSAAIEYRIATNTSVFSLGTTLPDGTTTIYMCAGLLIAPIPLGGVQII